MADVRWSVSARGDIEAIRDFIAQDSVQSAERMVRELKEAVSRLAEFPRLGKHVSGVDAESRLLIHGSYRIGYTLRGDVVMILAVEHTSRDSQWV